MTNIKPILVTGSHRSGTTWVGKVLATCPQLAYIHEPFSLACRPGICAVNFDNWFSYINEFSESSVYMDAFSDTLKFRYNTKAEIKSIRSLKDTGRLVRDYYLCTRNRRLGKTALIKDPIAFFSAPWLARQFDMNVLILIRHPAAFVSSLKRMNWSFPFSHFTNQPELMEKRLGLYKNEIKTLSIKQYDIIKQGCLLWNIIHSTIIDYQKEHPEWLFIKHEDISREPVEYFRSILSKFNLPFEKKTENIINEFSNQSNPVDIKGKQTHLLKRNSADNVFSWKNRLTLSEIKTIHSECSAVSSFFYTENEW